MQSGVQSGVQLSPNRSGRLRFTRVQGVQSIFTPQEEQSNRKVQNATTRSSADPTVPPVPTLMRRPLYPASKLLCNHLQQPIVCNLLTESPSDGLVCPPSIICPKRPSPRPKRLLVSNTSARKLVLRPSRSSSA